MSGGRALGQRMADDVGPPGPRRSLRTKAIVAVTLLVSVPTMLTGYITHRQAVEAIERSLLRDSQTLGRQTGHLLGRMPPGPVEADGALGEALDHIMEDQRVAFLVVTDDSGRVRAHRYNEPLAWHAYQRQLTPLERSTPLTLNRSIRLDGPAGSPLVVRRQMIRRDGRRGTSSAASADAGAESAAGRGDAVAGYLELGLHDVEQARRLVDLREATVVLVAGICLVCIPLVMGWVGGWVRPLRRMLVSMRRLAAGQAYEPVEVRRGDEIGLLARSFNTMADKLASSRRALTEANARLEGQVADRTADLREANRKLEREVAEKDQFLRAVSHDLGAPLRNIAGLTRLLLAKHREQMNEQVIEKLDRIAANVKAETELVEDLLDLGRIRARPGRPQPVDLARLVRSIGDQLAYDLQGKGIELVVASPMPTVLADQNRMRQVLQNLLDNAIKYMPPDAPVRRIEVGWRRDDPERPFYVRDTGRGVAPEDREAIFQVFRRARHGGGPKVEGRGVGLASVKTIVECHGGHVWVESDPPNGATFCFTLGRSHIAPIAGNGSAVERDAPGDLTVSAV